MKKTKKQDDARGHGRGQDEKESRQCIQGTATACKKQVTDEERHGRVRVWGRKQGLAELIGRVGVMHRLRLRTRELESC